MLKHVKIENFRCLRNVEVDLQPLTVLIGPNDSGKSAFLSAFRTLFDEKTQLGLPDFWKLDSANRIVVTAMEGDQPIEYSDKLRAGNYVVTTGGGVLQPALNPLRASVFFQLPSDGVSMESAGHADEGTPPQLRPNGSMMPALLDFLLRRDRKRFDAFVDEMRKRVDGLDDVQIATPNPQRRRVDLIIEGGLVIPADNASVGVRLLLFFVALSYHPQPPPLILLEEPETGFHPRRLGRVLKLLHDMTSGAHGGPSTQILLTTHSPYLLDHVDLDQDQVLVFRREDDGSRTAEPVDTERLKTFMDEFMLGEVWYNEDEDGLVARKGKEA